jgi:Beta-lactamase
VMDRPYEQVAAELLLEPLRLQSTLFFADDVMTRRFAVGHNRSENDETPPSVARPWSVGRAHHAAGGLVSTVRDLISYARFHLSDGEGVLSAASLEEMRRPQVAAAPSFGSVGITWAVDDSTGIRLVHHGGGTNGQVSLLVFAPESRTALAVVTNHDRGDEVVAAARRVLIHALGGREPEWIAVVLDAGEFLGTYRSPLYDVELVEVDDGLQLVLTSRGGFPTQDSPPGPSPPPMPVAFYERDKLFVPDGPAKGTEAEFLRGPDGRVAWLRFGGRIMQPLR